MKLRINNEIIIGAILILFNSVYLSQALKLPLMFDRGEPGPLFFPLVLVVAMYICAILVLTQGFKQEKNFTFNLTFFLEKPFLAIFFTALYIFYFTLLGYWITTFIYAFAISMLFAHKKNKIALIFSSLLIATIIAILVWLLFEIIFNIALPIGGMWENV